MPGMVVFYPTPALEYPHGSRVPVPLRDTAASRIHSSSHCHPNPRGDLRMRPWSPGFCPPLGGQPALLISPATPPEFRAQKRTRSPVTTETTLTPSLRGRGQKSPQPVPLPVPGTRCGRKVARCGRALQEGVLWSRARPRSPLQPWRPPPRPGSRGSPKWPRWAARGLVGGGRGRGWLGLGGGRDGRSMVPRAGRPSLSGGRGQGGPAGRGGHPRVSVVVVLEGVYLGEERGPLAQTRWTRHLLGAGAPGRAG